MRLTMPGKRPNWFGPRETRLARGCLGAVFVWVLSAVPFWCAGNAFAEPSPVGSLGTNTRPPVAASPSTPKEKTGGGKPRHPTTPANVGSASDNSANPGPARQPPDLAVVFDGTYRPAAKDLQLTLENERRAEADAHFIQGLLFEDTVEGDRAQGEYLKSLALDPANVDLSLKLAMEQLSRGDIPAAIGLLKDTIKAAPKKPQPYLALAYVYFKGLDKADLAQKYAAQALEADPNNIYVYQYLKEIYTALKQPAKITPLLERAAKSDSHDAGFWLQLGELYAESFLKNDPSKSPEVLRKTTLFFQKGLALDGNNPDALNRAAKFFVETQQYADAATAYQKIIQIDPEQTGARENLARCYLNSGQRDKAITTLEELIKLNPIQGHVYALLGGIYQDGKEFDKAAGSYQQSLLVSPNQPENYRAAALLFLEPQFNKPEKAVETMVEARRRFPEEPKFTYLLAVSLSSAKKYQEAVAAFEQCLLEAQAGDSDILRGGDFYAQFGNAAAEAGLVDKATDLLRKSLELEKDPRRIAEASNTLGYVMVEHDRNLEEAGGLIRKALEIDPGNGAYLDSLGWYYFKTSHYDKALAELRHAVEVIKPEDSTVFEHLGDTYSKLNDTSKAVDCWQRAVELNPEEPNRTALVKKLEDSKAQLTQARPAGT